MIQIFLIPSAHVFPMASNLTDVEHATEKIPPKSGNDEHGNDGETNEGILVSKNTAFNSFGTNGSVESR